MKNLSEYIEDNKEYFFEYWLPNPEYSFEQFCKDNKVSYNNKLVYEAALKMYERRLWKTWLSGEEFDYNFKQDIFYETLSHSLNTDKLKKELYKKLNDKIISLERYESGKTLKVPLYPLMLVSTEDLRYNETFDSIMNFYNYCIYRIYKDGEKYRIVLRPNFSVEKTEYVHSQKYLFHVTTKGKLKKILKYGYHPTPNIKHYDEPYKFHVFTDFKELSFLISSVALSKKRIIDNFKDYNDLYLTVIDVSKLKKEQRFFRDETYDNAEAFYTYEPILPSAIKGYAELTEKDLSNLDNINKLIEKLKK